ncbi:shikimate dehydrogenase family protein [Flavisphingomonas formosensis]|uniref:shikimate dehydrogenase family protein n=1 Tax=Flavisphingomonas formosensis TaxID=861534 RepID=UPI0012FAC9A3|nr:shikimate dehydrogenase [Sphingomonas formosensis]
MTAPYAEVIGDPISHSKSPVIHQFWLRQLGIEGRYGSRRVTPAGLRTYFHVRGNDGAWMGCNVTIPLKEHVGSHLDRLSERARRVGAVNCVHRDGRFLVGTNTDVAGVALAIAGAAADRPACVIGAGGAARAALTALRERGHGDVRIVARDPAKGRALLDLWGYDGAAVAIGDAASAFSEAGVVINASPLGMAGLAPMPLPVQQAIEGTAEGAVIFDMVYNPIDTALLAAARRRGRIAVDGLVMLVGQAREAFELFFGYSSPRDTASDAALRSLLTGG